jgi:hypothetical protein
VCVLLSGGSGGVIERNERDSHRLRRLTNGKDFSLFFHSKRAKAIKDGHVIKVQLDDSAKLTTSVKAVDMTTIKSNRMGRAGNQKT